jgi:hypothetical protein
MALSHEWNFTTSDSSSEAGMLKKMEKDIYCQE